jgi:hypothetical protein
MTQLLSADLSSHVAAPQTRSDVERAALAEVQSLRTLDEQLSAITRVAIAIRGADEQQALLAALDVANGPSVPMPRRRPGSTTIRD